jgi:hypothetical protein
MNGIHFERVRWSAALRSAVLLLLLISLSGCIEMHTSVNVRKDGSGTIVQKMLFTGMLGSMLDEAKQDEGAKGRSNLVDAMQDAASLKRTAAEFGPDVVVESVRKIDTDRQKGVEIRMAFTDIDHVRIGQSMAPDRFMKSDSLSSRRDSVDVEKKRPLYTFSMVRGPRSRLTILKTEQVLSSQGQSLGSPGSTRKDRKMALEFMKPFMKGMKVVFEVNVEGQVVESNATYRRANRITLVDLDFDRMLAGHDAMTNLDGLSDVEAKRKLGKLRGIRIETRSPMTVDFR